MVKINILLIFIFFSILPVKGQDTASSNNLIRVFKDYIGFEIGGTGLLYSLNYERTISLKKNIIQSIKIGASESFISGVDQFFIPVDYTAYIGKGNIQLLTGLGATVLISPSAFPASQGARQDYMQLYQANPSLALEKYGNTRYERPLDLAYTARIGFRIHALQRVSYYAYVNCFYIRLNMFYYFQPTWLSAGVRMRIHS